MRSILLAVQIRFLLIASVALCACADAPVVGDWESNTLGNGEKNKLTVESDFNGSAELFVTPKGQPDNWSAIEFKLEWEDEGDEFDLAMECDSDNCDGDDFVMECEVIEPEDETEDRLDCKTTSDKWADYPLQFEREISD